MSNNKRSIDRRILVETLAVLGGLGLVGVLAPTGGRAAAQPLPEIAASERGLGGRLGFSALDTASGRRSRHRADERFALKAALAAAVLCRIERGTIGADEALHFDPQSLLFNSPVSASLADDGEMAILVACEAAVTQSDNTAANLLLERIGGPAEMTTFFRSIGDAVTRLDRYELNLNLSAPGDERDTTTPDAMLGSLSVLLLGDVLSASTRDRLITWMEHEQRGRARIRAGLPAGWRVANKPGTGPGGETNDIAVAWPPDRAPIVVAVYVDAPMAEPDAGEAAIAAAAAAAADDLHGLGASPSRSG